MATYYLKNTSGLTVSVADLGLRITNNNSSTIDSNAINGLLTSDMATAINTGSLVLSTTDIGSSAGDFSIADAIAALTLISGSMKNNPNGVTFSQVVDADPLTDITVSEIEQLSNGSDADGLHNHDTRYYTKTLLGTANAGTVSIDWANIINTPSFGSNIWIEPVECNLHGIGSSAPENPQEGWFYYDNSANKLYKYESSSWVDKGTPDSGARFIYRDGSESNDYIYTYDGSVLNAGVAPVDNWTTLVKDDGDGRCAQYVYTNDELPPDWIKIADVNWGDHSILSNRNAIDSHPASAISFSGGSISATNVQDALVALSNGVGVSPSNILYVAKNGDDSNDGSFQKPFATIQAAIDAVPTLGGDAVSESNRYVIAIAAGTYTENIVLNVPYVYLIGADKNATIITAATLPTVTLSAISGIQNISIINTGTDYALRLNGSETFTYNVIASSINTDSTFSQFFNTVTVTGEFKVDAGLINITDSQIGNISVVAGSTVIKNSFISNTTKDAVSISGGTVLLDGVKITSGATFKDINQVAGIIYWGWVDCDEAKCIISNKSLIYSAAYISYSETLTVSDAIGEIAGNISTIETAISNHNTSTVNPHDTTLTQVIAEDAATDKTNLTITNINSLVNGSTTALHEHNAENIIFNNTTSGLVATSVQGALDELDATLGTESGNISNHTTDVSNPHNTTLTQVIAEDTTLTTNLSVTNLEGLVAGLNADTLHIHDSDAITFDPAGTGLSATNVGSAIAEITTLVSNQNAVQKGTAFPSSPEAGDLFYRTDLSMLYQYDYSRSTWLSITQMFLDWGSSSADGIYCSVHGAVATNTGYLMPRAGKIISITAKAASGNLSKTIEIRRNHNTTSPLKVFSLSSGSYTSINDNIDFVAGDYIQAFAVSNSVAARDLIIMATICWI